MDHMDGVERTFISIAVLGFLLFVASIAALELF
jgi:hypothetical protein